MGAQAGPRQPIAFGASYYPPFHDPADWERDVQRMAAAGLTIVRSGELIASWEWIEPRPGQFDWSWLDRLFELSRQYGMRMLVGTGAGSPPVWLAEKYPDVPIVSRDGVQYPTATMWGWACLDHPGYLEEAERYLRTLVARYKDHPALFGWQVHNEIGHPALKREGAGLPVYCYCQHTAARFRQWLQQRYPDIEALSEAWACTPTRHRYYDWHQVEPPRSLPTEWAPPAAWLDWRNFMYDDIAGFVTWQNDLLKALDPTRPTTTNMVDTLCQEFGVLRGADVWHFPRTTDAIGYDMYPGLHGSDNPTYCSYFLDNAWSSAVHNDVPLWLPEIESGPIGGWSLGPTHATSGLDIKRYDLESLAHGAKVILYQGYREWNSLPLHWGALVDLNGEPTERYDAARAVCQAVSARPELFAEALPPRAAVGLLYSQDNATSALGMGALEHLRLALEGIYRTLWELKVPVEFITPELFCAGKAAGYKVVFAPFMVQVEAALGAALASYVEDGGALVGFAKAAMLDGRGWYWNDRPGAGLDSIFGVKEQRISIKDDVTLCPEGNPALFAGVGGPLAGYWHQQELAVTAPETEVLARFENGQVAAVRHPIGRGAAYYFGTHLDAAARVHGGTGYRCLFSNLLSACGVAAPVSLAGSDSEYVARNVDVHLLDRGDERLLILVNHGAQAQDLGITLHAGGAQGQAHDLFADQAVTVRREGDALALDIQLAAFDGTALCLRPHSLAEKAP
jgi:beta-galactosidase